MQGGSLFRLDLVPGDFSDPSSPKHPVSTLTQISDAEALVATCLLNVQSSDSSTPLSSLRFILSICCGALKLCGTSGPPTLDFSKSGHKSVVALAIVVSIAQNHILSQERPANITGTSLDLFWSDMATSGEVVSRTLWKESVAVERRDEVRKWLFRAASSRLQALFFDPHPDYKEETMLREKTLTTSVVAWLEFSASSLEGATPETWEKEWENNWIREWDLTWNDEWGNKWTNTHKNSWLASKWAQLAKEAEYSITEFSKKFSIVNSPTIKADGHLSGTIAGRMSMNISEASAAVKIPSTSVLSLEPIYIANRGAQNNEGEEDMCGRSTRNKVLTNLLFMYQKPQCNTVSATVSNPDWLRSWRSLRHPGTEPNLISVSDSASNLAWALVWENAVNEGLLRVPHEPQGPPEQTQQSPTQLGREVELLQVYKQKRLAATLRVQKPGADTRKRVIADPLVLNMGSPAWLRALNSPGSPEFDLPELARRALAGDKFVNVAFALQNRAKMQPAWEEAFRNTWERVWKTCWQTSWKRTMEHTSNVVWDRGIQTGICFAIDLQSDINVDPAILLPPDSQISYDLVRKEINQGKTQKETYQHICSMFRALEDLYAATSAHIPTCFHTTLTIKFYDTEVSASWEAVQVYDLQGILQSQPLPIAATKAKLSRKGKPPRTLKHMELEIEIKKLVQEKVQLKQMPSESIQWIHNIWEEAVKLGAEANFVP